MMFIRTILALSLAAFALAAPVAEPLVDAVADADVLGTFCSSQYVLFTSLIDRTQVLFMPMPLFMPESVMLSVISVVFGDA